MGATRLRRQTHSHTAHRERGAGRSRSVWKPTLERRPEVQRAAFEPPQILKRVDLTGIRLNSTALHIVTCAIVDGSDPIETVAPSTRRSHSSSSPPSSSNASKRTPRLWGLPHPVLAQPISPLPRYHSTPSRCLPSGEHAPRSCVACRGRRGSGKRSDGGAGGGSGVADGRWHGRNGRSTDDTGGRAYFPFATTPVAPPRPEETEMAETEFEILMDGRVGAPHIDFLGSSAPVRY